MFSTPDVRVVSSATVIAVLVALVLGAVIGQQPPMDFSNVWSGFVSVGLLMGYFYFVRTLFRMVMIMVMVVTANFGDRKYILQGLHYSMLFVSSGVLHYFFAYETVIIERLILVVFAILAGIPTLHEFVVSVGRVGVVVMLAGYVLYDPVWEIPKD